MTNHDSASESNPLFEFEQKVKKKARELVERSKSPQEDLEQYPSDARSMEKYLDEDRLDEVTMYFCDLARYEDGGVVAFCEWLTENCPSMLYGNHTMWIMMEEDGITEEKIHGIYLKVGYDINNQKKETVIDSNSLNRGKDDSKDSAIMKIMIISALVIIGINVIMYFQYIDYRADIYETGDEISDDMGGNYAIFASSNTHDCEEDWVSVKEKGPMVFNSKLNKTVQVWRANEVTAICDSFYNGDGWIFVGTVTLEDGSTYRTNASDSSTEIALLGAPSLRATVSDVPGYITIPVFYLTLLALPIGIYNAMKYQ